MLLEVEHLSTEFTTRRGKVRAIRDVSFNIAEGEILALVGESGSGKSVTSLSIMGLLNSNGRVVEGSKIIFDGQNLLELSEHKLQKIRGNSISMIFQEPMTSLNPIFTVGDQILESILLHTKLNKKEAREKLIDLLDTVGIPNPQKRIHDYPHQMSGGMRQRIMIAMAMACEPKLLIADEPTTALDVTIQAQILDLIYRMRDKFNISVLLITHDLGVVAEAADLPAMMAAAEGVGRILDDAQPLAAGEVVHFVEVPGIACVMYRHDGDDVAVQPFFGVAEVQRAGLRQHVAGDGQAARGHDGLEGSHEGQGRDQYPGDSALPGGQAAFGLQAVHSQGQRGRARIGGDDLPGFHAEPGGQLFFKAAGLGPHAQIAVLLDDAPNGLGLGGAHDGAR